MPENAARDRPEGSAAPRRPAGFPPPRRQYHPAHGRLLPGGNLSVPVTGPGPDGGRWDGDMEIRPDHPNYAAWREAIEQREAYSAALARPRAVRDERPRR